VSITAKDVQALRQSTGVGMMDAKKALVENDGDMVAATQWLRVHGLASAAKRADREAGEGAVAVVRDGNVAAIVELKCETDFVAKSEDFVSLVDEIAARVAAEGEGATASFQERIETLLTTLKENISLGRVYRLEVAVHIAFTKPLYLSREDVPQSEVDAERTTVEEISRNEGKPEAALPKIIEGRLNGWFKERVLLEQPYVKDEKQTIEKFLGTATITAYAQAVIGS
jgi:elongation factor Ts